jgi:hypothetical protein
VDGSIEVRVDLPESVTQAFEFNRWADLVASAEASRTRNRG